MSSPRIPLAVVPVAVGLLIGGGIVIHRQLGSAPAAAQTSTAKAAAAGLIVSSDHLDFGVMEIGQAVVRPLLLRNSGSDPLHVNIQAAGSGWTVEPASLTLEPGGIQRVKIIGTRSDSAAVSGEIRILTDGMQSDAVVVSLAGGASSNDTQLAARSGASENGAGLPVYGSIEPGYGATAAGDAASGNGALGTRAAGPAARVSVTGDRPQGSMGASGSAARGASDLNASVAGTNSVVPFDPGTARLPRSMADRPSTPTGDRPARNGETPVPINPAPSTGDDPTTEPPAVGVSALVVSPSSTIHLLGTRNQFYAQQINVTGSTGSSSFSLGSPLQVPKVPLAFGQSMEFTQNGSAVGAFDMASGQVTMQLPISAVDSNGNSAPIVFSMTTGTIVTRNANGVLVSLTGQPRSASSGQLRLVGIAKIPTGFRNGAEQQLVTIDVVGSLTFASPTTAQNASDTAPSGVQENL